MEMQKYGYKDSEVRTIMEDENIWFVAKDVCDILGIVNSRTVTSRLDEDERGVRKIYTLGGEQPVTCVTEPGLYQLILRSNKKEAKEFKRWIVHKVLPTIRKTGGYVSEPNKFIDAYFPDMDPVARDMMIAALEAKRMLTMQNDVMKPKAEFYDRVTDSRDAIEMSMVSKVLGIDGMGRNNIFKLLREKKVLRDNGKNEPYQNMIDMGYFRVVEQEYEDSYGNVHVTTKTLVYQKGLDFIRRLIEQQIKGVNNGRYK